MMSLDLTRAVWDELKTYIGASDISDAAGSFVDVLIDNDYLAEDVLDTFRNDADIKSALSEYLDDTSNEDEVDYEDDDF
jgi:hypothetical protein